MMKRKNKSKSGASDSAVVAKRKKVSSPNADQQPTPTEDEEVWDMDCRISCETPSVCRMDGCENQAVATWSNNLNPDDKWDVCEECQLKEFGDFPIQTDNEETNEAQDEEDESKEAAVEGNEETGDDDDVADKSKPKDSNEGETGEVEKPIEDSGKDNENGETHEMIPQESTGDHEERTIAPKNVSEPQDLSEPCLPKADPTDESSACSPKADPTDESSMSNEIVEVKIAHNTSDNNTENESTSKNSDQERSDEEETEMWDLKGIVSLEDLTKKGVIKCSTDECRLPACSIWVSNWTPNEKWYCCLDCQENDFGGWPNEDMPVDELTPEHLRAISTKCSKKRKPVMPNFPSSATCSPLPKETPQACANFVTPPPSTLNSVQGREEPSGTLQCMAKTHIVSEQKVAKPSAGALAMHKRWQDAAEAIGGPESRIVVSKPAAKKLIFDLLFDAFAPMNITEIYKKLKAVVPSPVLATCLKDMALDRNGQENTFADSDDEEVSKSSTKMSIEDSFAGSLFFKVGKSQSTNLYYVDYTKLPGCDRDERERLTGDLAIAQAEEAALKEELKRTLNMSKVLLAEPTNEELHSKLEVEEPRIREMQETLESAQKLKVNEKYKLKLKRKIQNMASHWRRRKRLCLDFLISLEENTDGAVRAKKCLAGDGQLSLDSDETIASSALEYARQKRNRGGSRGLKSRLGRDAGLRTHSSRKTSDEASLADDRFVAVRLDSQNTVCRVYVDHSESE